MDDNKQKQIGMVTLKIELDVAASKVLHQLQMRNEEIQAAVDSGVKKALDELVSEGNFEELVKNRTKEEFLRIVDKTIVGYEMERKIQEALNKAIGGRLADYATILADKLVIAINDKG